MSVRRWLGCWIATIVVFTGIDHFWLKIVARGFYLEALGPLLRADVWIPPALAAYVVLALGLVVFAVRPALTIGSWIVALRLGALVGFVAYGAYDLTNLATLHGFPVRMAVVDLAWGTTLSGVVSAIVTAGALRVSDGRLR